MTLELDQLRRCMGCSGSRAAKYLTPINETLERFDINTPARIAAFLAQIGHETMGLAYSREIWGPTSQQLRYDPPSNLAQRLGNTKIGDGRKYMGRGLIQTTGRANYKQMSDVLGEDFIEKPELLEQPTYAALSAGVFWDTRGCNALADAGRFEKLTRTINGGINGLEDRMRRWSICREVLGEQ